jgi:hypothetical protein
MNMPPLSARSCSVFRLVVVEGGGCFDFRQRDFRSVNLRTNDMWCCISDSPRNFGYSFLVLILFTLKNNSDVEKAD